MKAGPGKCAGTHPTKEGPENRITRAHACLRKGAHPCGKAPASPQRRQRSYTPLSLAPEKQLRKNTEVLTIN